MENLRKKVTRKPKSKEALVGIVGSGYARLPLTLRYDSIGFRVPSTDVDVEKVRRLNSSESYIEYISAESTSHACSSGSEATTDFPWAEKCDAPIPYIPTPLNRYREPDMSFVVNMTEVIKPCLCEGRAVSLESTTYPGTTEEELLPRVQSDGLVVGKSVSLVYSLECENPGNPNFEIHIIPKAIGEHTPECLGVGVASYKQATDKVVLVSFTKAAEMTKLLEDIRRAVNIGLVNGVKVVTNRTGIGTFEVVDAAATKPFGSIPYCPGPGLRGHCIPIDPFYLAWKARGYGSHIRPIELSDETNKAMPEYIVSKLMDKLGGRGKALKDSHVLILDIACRKNVDDMHEFPPIGTIELIQAKGSIASYNDPHVPSSPEIREHHFDLASKLLTTEKFSHFDAVMLVTDHDRLDYDLIHAHTSLIVDSHGKYRAPSQGVIRT